MRNKNYPGTRKEINEDRFKQHRNEQNYNGTISKKLPETFRNKNKNVCYKTDSIFQNIRTNIKNK